MKPTMSRKPMGNKKRSSSSSGGRGFRKKQNRFNMVFISDQVVVDYKEGDKLSRFITEKGKIIPRRITGVTARQQRVITRAVKRARHAGFLPFQTS